MPKALSRLPDTPIKGQTPKNLINRILLANMAVTISSKYSSMAKTPRAVGYL
jgi:hypothetical protein